MFRRLASTTVRHRRLVLALTGVLLVVAGAGGGGVMDKLKAGGFFDPGSESANAETILQEQFGAGEPDLVVVVTADEGTTVDDPAVVAAAGDLTARLAEEPGVARVLSYWSIGSLPPFRSPDADRALAAVWLMGDDDARDKAFTALRPRYEGDQGAVSVGFAGKTTILADIGATAEHDLARAEMIALPIMLVLLVLFFRSVVAAMLPLAVGLMAILGTFVVLTALASVTDVSVFSISLTTALGLGLAIDYSLFIVSRFREELHAGASVDDAVVRTVDTAGRTVAFSALIVAVSLAALLIFPLYFLRSFAYAGIAVVLLAALASVVSLPALLAVLGHRVNALAIGRPPAASTGTGPWHRVATMVMRRPIGVATAAVAFLLVLGLPFLGANFGLPDDRVLPAGAATREVSDVVREDFPAPDKWAFGVVLRGSAAGDDGQLAAYAAALSQLDGAARVDARTGMYADGSLLAGPSVLTARYRPAGRPGSRSCPRWSEVRCGQAPGRGDP